MTLPLRKYHAVIWRILAVLLPVIFCLAIMSRPEYFSAYDNKVNSFSFEVTKLTNTTGQLTVNLTSPLRSPSCLVYISSHLKKILVGKIDHQGAYQFTIPVEGDQAIIVLYDPIQKKEITRAVLTYNKE